MSVTVSTALLMSESSNMNRKENIEPPVLCIFQDTSRLLLVWHKDPSRARRAFFPSTESTACPLPENP